MTDKLPRATHSGNLAISDPPIPCAVLDDGTRVLSDRGITRALGGKRGGSHWRRRRQDPSGAHLPVYLSANNLIPFIDDDLDVALKTPKTYLTKTGKVPVQGMEAALLPRVFDVLLKARDAGALHPSQENIATAADILMRGLAHVGIIALVDEATGYQDERTRRALQEILDEFIAKELRPWVKTFPDEFYKEVFRLNRWPYDPTSIKRPQVIGRWTNDVIYDRLAPGVRQELHELVERDEKGRPKHRLFQRLSEGTGHPKLKEHLIGVTSLMRASSNWRNFKQLLQRAFPKYGDQIEMFEEEEEDD